MSQGVTPKAGTCHRGGGSRDTWVGQLPPAHPPPTHCPAHWGVLTPHGGTRARPGTPVPPFLSAHPKPFTQPYHIHPSISQGRERTPESPWGCPMPKASPARCPPWHSAHQPHPVHAPALPGWGTAAEPGPGDASPPGSAGTRTLLYFSLLFLVNKALDMLGGCQGPWPGDGSSEQHPQPCAHGTGTPLLPTRLFHQCHTPCLFNTVFNTPLSGIWCPHGCCIQTRDASESHPLPAGATQWGGGGT